MVSQTSRSLLRSFFSQFLFDGFFHSSFKPSVPPEFHLEVEIDEESAVLCWAIYLFSGCFVPLL